MSKFYLIVFAVVMMVFTGCGEPSQKEIKQSLTRTLKSDTHISKEFVETLEIKYVNGTLIFYDNCPKLVKLNDEKLSKIYDKKEKTRKGDVWGNLLAIGMGDNIWDQSIKFRRQCQQMRYRAAKLSQMIDGVKEVKVLK